MADPTLLMRLLGRDETASKTIKGVGDEADKTGGKVSAMGKAGSVAGTALKLGAVAAGAGIAAIAISGIKGAAALETTQTAFTSLLGSSAAAQKQITELQKFAAATPFSQQDVLGYAQQFYSLAGSIGMSKAQVEPFLSTIGNLGAVTGASTGNIKNAVMAIGQIGSAGKVTLDNLNQISEAFPGFNGAAAIASATGQTTAQVMKKISAGSIDAKVGVKALLEGMAKFPGAAGAMEKQSKTLAGQWSTFTDTIQISLTKAIVPLLPALKLVLTGVTNLLSNYVLPAFNKTVSWIISNWPKIQAVIVTAWKGYIQPALMAVVNVFRQYVIPAVAAAINYIVQHWPQIQKAFVMFWQTVKPLLMAYGRMLQTLWHTVLEPLVSWVKQHWSEISTALKVAFAIIAVTFKAAALVITFQINVITTAIKVLATTVSWLYNNVWKPEFDLIVATVTTTKNAIMTSFNAVVGFFSALPGRISGFASAMFTPVRSAATSAYTWVTDKFNGFVGFFGGLGGKIAKTTLHMFDGIAQGFKAAINFLIGIWDRLHFHIGGGSFLGVSFPSFDLGVPQIPRFAAGGIVTGPTLGMIGEGGQPEAIVPLNRAKDFGFGGGSPEIHIHINGVVAGTSQQVGAFIAKHLVTHAQTGGSLAISKAIR